MISSLDHSSVPWQDNALLNARKTLAAQKAEGASQYPGTADDAQAVLSFSHNIGSAAAPSLDNGINSALYAPVVKEPALREVEARGVSYKDDGLMMMLINDDDTQNDIYTVNPKDNESGSKIVYVETNDRGTVRGYEVDVSKVDLRHCSRIEALAVASYIKDEIAARSDGTTSDGTKYSKCLISDFYNMASDAGAMFASTNDIAWNETIDFISIAERHLAHWSEPIEGASKPKIADGDAIAQCIQIADELSGIIDAQEKLPPEQRNLSYEGWDEIDVTKLGAPEPTVSSARSTPASAALRQSLDVASFIQSAEQRASDAWQELFDSRDEDDKKRA